MGERRSDLRGLAGRLAVSGKVLARCSEALRWRRAAEDRASLKRHLRRTALQICGLVREILSLRDEPQASHAARRALHEVYLKSGGDERERSMRQQELRDAVVDLRGEGRVLPIPEILGFVSSLRRSGMLWVHGSVESFLVQVSEGAVVFAQGDSPPPGQRIGEILVANGATSHGQVQRVLRGEDNPEGLLGRALIDQGIVTADQLSAALRQQIQLIFHRLFTAQDANFEFLSGMTKVVDEDVNLNVTQLLLESARTSDELIAPTGLALPAPI